MLVATWNVNSVRQRAEHLVRWLTERRPDIVCLQELKCLNEAFPSEPVESLGYNVAVHGQKGFNGVAILSKLPLEVVSEGVPSSTFMKAAEIWNKGTSTTGGVANLKLPTVDVKVATTPITINPPVPYAPVVVPKGTRLAIVSENKPPVGSIAGSVRVVDGPHFGCTGEVNTSDWAMIVDERS